MWNLCQDDESGMITLAVVGAALWTVPDSSLTPRCCVVHADYEAAPSTAVSQA